METLMGIVVLSQSTLPGLMRCFFPSVFRRYTLRMSKSNFPSTITTPGTGIENLCQEQYSSTSIWDAPTSHSNNSIGFWSTRI